MASILKEYIGKKLGILDLQNELQALVAKYNALTGRFLFVYASDINKGRTRGIDVSLVQEDFYAIQDILRETEQDSVDFYLETPGGSGEAAEEIAKFLHKKFREVNFVIAGEAKSAGTILALSGDNIHMTETGSLGPIDAQVKIGRSVVSAHDYKAWVDEKKDEAAKNGNLNPFDAIMVAQISPGEIYGVINSLEFAKDLVKEWLEKYKFKNWKETEGQKKPVTPEVRRARASEVAELLCNHTAWRTHGRSLKIEDLKDVLLIHRIDEEAAVADVVYRIRTVIGLIFGSSTIYKVFYTQDLRLNKTFTIQAGKPAVPERVGAPQPGQIAIDSVEIEMVCPQCSKKHLVHGYLDLTSDKLRELAPKLNLKLNPNIQDNDILICDNCSFAIDLKAIKSQIETQTKKKVVFK